jgi:hypothetical protein
VIDAWEAEAGAVRRLRERLSRKPSNERCGEASEQVRPPLASPRAARWELGERGMVPENLRPSRTGGQERHLTAGSVPPPFLLTLAGNRRACSSRRPLEGLVRPVRPARGQVGRAAAKGGAADPPKKLYVTADGRQAGHACGGEPKAADYALSRGEPSPRGVSG